MLAVRTIARDCLWVCDERTTGLHLADVEELPGLLDRLVDSGEAIIVIEHHQAIMHPPTWTIDLGRRGLGRPAELIACAAILIGGHLATYAST